MNDFLFEPRRLRDRHEKYFQYLKSRIDKAFDWGTIVSVRRQVWHEDVEERFGKISVPCPTCYDEVRQEACDPHCPVCQGNGWVEQDVATDEITGGYRPLQLFKAHVEEISDEQRRRAEGGFTHAQSEAFWVQYDQPWRLRDGDLIAEVIPDDYKNPRRVRKVLQKYEIKANITPDFKPVGTVDDNLVAQRVAVVTIDRERPEWAVDMGEEESKLIAESTGSRKNITEFDL